MQTGRSKLSPLERLLAREPAPGWSLTTMIVFVVAYIIIWIAALTLISVLKGEINGQSSAETWAVGALLAGLVTTFGVLQWSRRRLGDKWLYQLGLGPVRNSMLIAVLLFGLGSAWTIDLIGLLLKLKTQQMIPPVLLSMRGPLSVAWIVAAIVALVVQPLAEGIVFGGIVYPTTARQFNDNRVGIIATTGIYVLVMLILAVQQETWYAIWQPLLMGLVVIGVRAFTKSTRAAIAARLAFGLFFVLAALVATGLPS